MELVTRMDAARGTQEMLLDSVGSVRRELGLAGARTALGLSAAKERADDVPRHLRHGRHHLQ